MLVVVVGNDRRRSHDEVVAMAGKQAALSIQELVLLRNGNGKPQAEKPPEKLGPDAPAVQF